MFEHADIEVYDFEHIPLNRDIYLVDEKWMGEYNVALVEMLNGGNYEPVGFVSYAVGRAILPFSIDLSWYPNISERFHEVRISLPRDQFVACAGCDNYDEKPRIFVKGAWVNNLHRRAYSVFAMVDAIGVKEALPAGGLTRAKLVELRGRIDELAKNYPDIAFVSFADGLLLKSTWSAGDFESHITYSYDPEIFLRLIPEIRSIYLDVLGLNVYAVLTQGSNEYYDDALLHTSETGNHISLNSIGVPFAQLLSIEGAARAAIRKNEHAPAELYMDQNFYHSLRFALGFDKNARPKHPYQSPMAAGDRFYFYADTKTIMDNLMPLGV